MPICVPAELAMHISILVLVGITY
uniref:Uncharacterized protein n=1 Tax=Arundo donax TaxID=35708 RepID=A0A0A9G7C1_ARUDO